MVFSLEDHPVMLACIANLALLVSSSPCSCSNTLAAWDVLSADLFSMLPQSFCPSTPNDLGRLFCHSCFKDESLFQQACVQVSCSCRSATSSPIALHIHCLWGFHLLSSVLIARKWGKRDPRKLENVRDMMKHRGKSFCCMGELSFGGWWWIT